jgi:iron(III) transport system ATP-binding protein
MFEMRKLLKSLNMTAIFVTHNKDEVFTFADKISIMDQGEILQTDEPTKVYQHPKSWQVADFLQLGSWIPLKSISKGEYQSAIGSVRLTDVKIISKAKCTQNSQHFLLLKPQFIKTSTTTSANVRIENISITEQGFHYILSSLTNDSQQAFNKLSYYCNDVFFLGQELSISIKPHLFVIFDRAKS